MVPRSHFMHQGHALVQNLNTIGYCCGGCKTDGIGTNFGCAPCSFHMHEFCSNCPMILSSFLHPEHPLSLMISNTLSMAPPRICDVCRDTVEGLFYWCQTCNFSVHPLCTRFPQSLLHAVHYPHRLMFQKSYKDAPCCVCRRVCDSWRYRCGYCDGFDVHVDCVAESYDAKSYDTTTTTRRLPPRAGLYTYGGVDSTANSHNMCHSCSGSASGTHQTGMPPNINSYNVHNPNLYSMYYPCNTNPCSMYNPQNGASFNSTLQHVQNHHGDTSHQAPAQGQELVHDKLHETCIGKSVQKTVLHKLAKTKETGVRLDLLLLHCALGCPELQPSCPSPSLTKFPTNI
ncbi:Phorbol-ester/DAG-type domain-containing protein [Heracleum sosnowskyi]|uniref:Phorbol-ester/DAG-type domain-containing protein n=1 Tax=Heracleum sosnowskyi TaxID=360622 RepID=A0AAD8M7W5_9APIA|nr:Phorbol-ester/DAG-type domain-containing protein [Heracleum sosnowskyi]